MKHTSVDLLKLLQTLDHELKTQANLALLDFPTYILATYPGTEAVGAPYDLLDQIRVAHNAATMRTHLQIPLHPMAAPDFPFLFETRLTPLEIPSARNLKVSVVDRHDTVITKILRNEKKEYDTIAKMGHSAGLSYDLLLNSFCAIDTTSCEMRRVRQQFLELIEMVFGETSVMQAEALIAERMG